MPSLNSSPRRQVTVSLPSFEVEGGAPVTATLIESLTMGELRALRQKYPRADDTTHDDATNATFEMLSKMIIKWDFDEEATTENLAKLPSNDFAILAAILGGGKEKKSVS